MTLKVALLGTGEMGAPMARNIAGAGFGISVWNRTHATAQPLGDVARVCETIAEAVADADVIITMLSNDVVVGEVLFGADGVCESAKKGACLVDMSSIQPHRARKHAAQAEALGLRYLDAPVSGGEVGAIAGTMVIFVGGAATDFDNVLPVFVPMGRATHVGNHGAGQVAKLANQIIVGVTIAAVSEAMVLAQKCGCDPDALRGALTGGFATSAMLGFHGKRMFDPDYVPGARIGYLLKDLNNSLEKADEVGLTLPLTALARETEAAQMDYNSLHPKQPMENALHAVYAHYYKA